MNVHYIKWYQNFEHYLCALIIVQICLSLIPLGGFEQINIIVQNVNDWMHATVSKKLARDFYFEN